ncbi:MAG: winged helix-turn-helix transcriptional regulator [Chloroflexi bacterium]|nr:winged helix-turn-helix transcriptional regulator [Chloroflexota bacterium]
MYKIYRQNCPVAKTLDILGDRWTLLIVRDLLKGKARFKDLEASLPGIPTNILADRLKLLEANQIVVRTYYCAHPPRAEYHLTPRGQELSAVIAALALWGARHLSDEQRFELVHTGCGAPVDQQWVCPACGKEIPPLRVHTATIRPE